VKSAIRAAFVMEQVLGHVTHGKNLAEALAGQGAVEATWLPISFDVRGPGELLPLWRSNWSIRASARARLALGKALRAQPHDALYFHTQVTSLFSARMMERIPTVISLDATPVNYDSLARHYGQQPAGEGFLDRQKFRLNQRTFQAATALVCWSDWARRSLVVDYGVDAAKVRVIAPGAAKAYFEIGRRRAPRQGADAPVRLLFVGGDFVRKGGPLLLECMRGPLGQRCELHVVTQSDVAPRANVHVHHGLRPNSAELLRLFAEADVFVLPTQADCLAVVLMEATAAGLPVVTTDVGALGEAVRPGETGFVIRPGHAAELAQAIDALVADAGRRQAMGRAGFALAGQKFDAVANNRAVLEMIVDVARRGRADRSAA
jgi:glycosyltransferase involved in cell wall biosynthesis